MNIFPIRALIKLCSKTAKRHKENKGFVLPIVLGLGFLMVLFGISMVLRSQDEKLTVITQKDSMISLAATESGINRVVNFLRKNYIFSQYDFAGVAPYVWQKDTTWQTLAQETNRAHTESLVTEACLKDSDIDFVLDELRAYASSRWIDIEASDPDEGQFQVVDYIYRGITPEEEKVVPEGTLIGTGVLRVRSRTNISTIADEQDTQISNASVNFIQVELPFIKEASHNGNLEAFPGLWVYEPSISPNQLVRGNILVSGTCDAMSSDERLAMLEAAIIPPDSGELFEAYGLRFPPLPPDPRTYLTLDNDNLSNDGDFYNHLPVQTGGEIFPRVTDDYRTEVINGIPTRVYRYFIEASGGKSIFLKAKDIIVETGEETIDGVLTQQMVIFHLEGSMDIRADASIKHFEMNTAQMAAADKPASFQIYGRQGGDNEAAIANSAGIFDAGDPFICLSGSPESNFFIHAPNYSYGINGSGDKPANFYGAIFVKQLLNRNLKTSSGGLVKPQCQSTAGQIIVEQSLGESDVGMIEGIIGSSLFGNETMHTPIRIGPYFSWERLPNE